MSSTVRAELTLLIAMLRTGRVIAARAVVSNWDAVRPERAQSSDTVELSELVITPTVSLKIAAVDAFCSIAINARSP